MVKGRIVVSNNLLTLIDITKKELAISSQGYVESLIEICMIAIEKEKKKRKERKRVKAILQKTFVFLQEKCNEVDYINEEFFQGLIQLDRNLQNNKFRSKKICIGEK